MYDKANVKGILMKLAVQFGAGNIGRGFLGQLFYESGYHTIFVDVVPELVHNINQLKMYPIKIVGETEQIITVQNIQAVLLSQVDEVVTYVETADIIATAVGAKGVADVSSILAKGIINRLNKTEIKPLNIIICENLPEPKQTFYKAITSHLPKELIQRFDENIGLVEASIGRMVPIIRHEDLKEHPLLIRVEEYCELPVDKDALKGEIPNIKGMKLCRPFSAYVHRKLYVHNLTHAVCAYLGKLKNYKYIWESVEDETIRNIAKKAGLESAQAIHKLDGLPYEELDQYIDDLLKRYNNRGLGDQIERVARDPIRKLGPGERLIGPGMYCIRAGINPEHVSLGIAGAIYYNGEDETSQELIECRKNYGDEWVLKNICKIDIINPLYELVINSIQKLKDMNLITPK